MNKKAVQITALSVAGSALIATAAISVWNSKQLKAARTVRRASDILYKTGTVLQTLSHAAENVQ